MAFAVLIEMASRWGGSRPEPATSPVQATFPIGGSGPDAVSATSVSAVIPGFDRFMIERFTAISWAVPTNPSFNTRDAQARQLIMEIATLHRTIFDKTGKEFIAYLRDVYFPGMQLDKGAADEYLQVLQTKDLKTFKQFFVVSFLQQPAVDGFISLLHSS